MLTGMDANKDIIARKLSMEAVRECSQIRPKNRRRKR